MHEVCRRAALTALAAFGTSAAMGTRALAQPSPPRVAFTLAQATASVIHAPIYVARALKYFENEALDVDVVITGGAANAVSAVVAGSVPICSAGLSDDLNSAMHGKPLIAFATLTRRDPDNIVIAKSVAEAKGISAKTPLAEKIKALKGLKVGVSSIGALPDQVLRWLLKPVGIDPDRDLTMIALHDPAAAVAALQRGIVDALIFPPPATEAAVDSGAAVMLIDVAHGEITPGYRICLMATAAYLDANANVAQRVVRAIAAAQSYIQANPVGAGASIRPYFASMPDEAFASAWNDVRAAIAPTPAIGPADVSDVAQFMARVSGKPVDVAYASVATDRFVRGLK